MRLTQAVKTHWQNPDDTLKDRWATRSLCGKKGLNTERWVNSFKLLTCSTCRDVIDRRRS